MTLPYKPDNDQAARRFIDDALRHQNPQAWSELMDPEYVEQTERVLKQIVQTVQTAFTSRAAKIEEVRADREAGLASRQQLLDATVDYQEWKTRTAHFRNLVNERLRLVSQARKAANRARWERRKLTENDHLRRTLACLADAVTRHRNACPDPTTDDRLLWARLDTLTLPDGEPGQETVTLAEYAERRLTLERQREQEASS